MKSHNRIHSILGLALIIISLTSICLPAYAEYRMIAPEVIQSKSTSLNTGGNTENVDVNSTATLLIAMDAFERFDALLKDNEALLKEHHLQLANPYQREDGDVNTKTISYNPLEGLSVSASVQDDSLLPAYTITQLTTDGVTTSINDDPLLFMMSLFLMATHADLTPLVAENLMGELYFGAFYVMLGKQPQFMYYDSYTLDLKLHVFGRAEGHTLVMTPLKDPVQEYWNGSKALINARHNRFVDNAREKGFDMSEEPEIEISEDAVSIQYCFEYMPEVWWADMLVGDMYLGSLVNVGKESVNFDRVADLHKCLLMAYFPFAGEDEISEMYEALELNFISALSAGENITNMMYNDLIISMSTMDNQLGTLIINPYDPAELQKRVSI